MVNHLFYWDGGAECQMTLRTFELVCCEDDISLR